ncbi:MAG: hypothetical protein C4532_03700 [Candidatus Abyssobacteria bacterium SURF_17]|uniref:Uncharacterized protein n=1 Tax=Candidatus Abyssobacteria bacterium SURF_17 TaxID=2093361 RepID=A0A419F6B5_9BACT|nr:MAG: hypothetical protein C4532_03700 [Candidatus Abyssubacteria bacterium SURF_17]
MNTTCCRKEITLTEQEKEVFSRHLKQQELSDNVWDLFGEWIARSTSRVSFFYLKVYRDDELIGLGLFVRTRPFDLRTSYSALRNNRFLRQLAGSLSVLANNCVYLSFRNLITSNLTRPFFYQEPAMANDIMKAFLAYLKNEKEADMVIVVDTSIHDDIYQTEGFLKYPSSSEAWLDATRYKDISEYLAEHRSLKKNLARRRKDVTSEVQQGPVSDPDRKQMKSCVECSVENSRVNTPCQKFFEDNIFETDVFNSHKYVHFLVRVDGTIAGFHTFQVSGSDMGGVLGGFNRDYSQKSFAYERVIVASLDYAIKNNIKRVHYSLIDNYTKLRLIDSVEPCGLYFYSGSPLKRKMFKLTNRFGDIHRLYLLEKQGRKESKQQE